MRTLCIRDLHCFQSFRNTCLFCTFWFIRNLNSTDSHHAYYGERCSNHHFWHGAKCVSEIYSVLKLFEIAVCFHIFLFSKLNSADSHHASYGKRCSNHHFQHCAQCVYEIYSLFKVFEIAVCFAHFGLFEISTPVMSNMLTMANIVWMIITNIAHTVYIWF